MSFFNSLNNFTQKRLFPFSNWIEELKDFQVLKADVIAGLTVALVLVPQSMAYAQLAGLPPYYGLYASFLPVALAALFGSSRQLATGPVAVVSLLTAAALEPIAGANPEGYIAYAIMLALLVGIFQLLLGILKMGVLVDFLSHPVVNGFTNAAAIIIGTSQLSKIFGVVVPTESHHYETIINVLSEAINSTHSPTFIMGISAILIIAIIRKFFPKYPAVLISVSITTFISWFINFESIYGGKIVGVIPEGLPNFQIPIIDFSQIVHLGTVAIIISLIGFMEAISIAKAMATQTKQRLDPDQELVGQGIGNIVSSFFQGYAISGSFSRSAVNITAGAKTGFSSVITAIFVGLTLLFFTPLLYHLPQATLAAVIIMAVINLIKFKPIKYAWRVQKHDAVISIVTFFLTLYLAPQLEYGIIVGVILSLGLHCYREMRPRVICLSKNEQGAYRNSETNNIPRCCCISVMRFDGSLIFMNAGHFENEVIDRVASKPELRFFIIDAVAINEIDATGEEMLHSLSSRLYEQGISLFFVRLQKPIMQIFNSTGFSRGKWENHFHRTIDGAIEYAWSELGCGNVTPPFCTMEYCPLNRETVGLANIYEASIQESEEES
ncbi:MAG: SulP family inorganic anion transporter [Pseudomonadota bacterium]|nr:SulP family inorganic anion transporter [Pseudomonadota bacterium]